MNEKEWERHENLWGCVSKLDCALHALCLLQARRNVTACAPYPGPANYKVPAPQLLAGLANPVVIYIYGGYYP